MRISDDIVYLLIKDECLERIYVFDIPSKHIVSGDKLSIVTGDYPNNVTSRTPSLGLYTI